LKVENIVISRDIHSKASILLALA